MHKRRILIQTKYRGENMNKKIFSENKKILDQYDIFESSSPTDCTGLISIPALSYDEWIGYNEIVTFAPPKPIFKEPQKH